MIIIQLTSICCGSCNKKYQVVIWVQSQSNEPNKMLDDEKNNKIWINIYVLPFKTMASCSFFIHMKMK